MRLSVCGCIYRTSVYVSINEAVELAKKFDHEKAPAFINGVLNKVAEVEGIKARDSQK